MELNNFIPPLRYDISTIKHEADGKEYVILIDPLGIAKQNAGLTKEFFEFMRSIDTGYTFQRLKDETQNDELFSLICDSIAYLDECGFLMSDTYLDMADKIEEEYSSSPVRPMITAGTSYPEDAAEFEKFAERYFTANGIKFDKDVKALILPHIDFSLGELSTAVYSKGYSAIAESDYDLFVIFGTSHRAATDYFMFSEKNYLTPLGTVEIDKELLHRLKVRLGDDLTIDDFAHKFEHSVEFHAVLLKHYFRNKRFKILPILVSSPYPFIINNEMPDADERSNMILEILRDEIASLGRKAFYIASVDFAHIGRKFGDKYDAEQKFEELQIEDKKLIDYIEQGNRQGFFSKIIADQDKWKICGNSSIYSLMQMIDAKSGKLIDYAMWDEQATKSAVSFASIALFDE